MVDNHSHFNSYFATLFCSTRSNGAIAGKEAGKDEVCHDGCEPPNLVWPTQEHWHAHQPRPVAGISPVGRVNQVLYCEMENL